MDDILSCVNIYEQAPQLRNQLIEILENTCFPLSTWKSNGIRPIAGIAFGNRELIHINFENADSSKVLGFWWNSKNDALSF